MVRRHTENDSTHEPEAASKADGQERLHRPALRIPASRLSVSTLSTMYPVIPTPVVNNDVLRAPSEAAPATSALACMDRPMTVPSMPRAGARSWASWPKSGDAL